ncbi:IS66 family insertion sequence element accessory protein TnpA [Paenibacillus periandrae]
MIRDCRSSGQTVVRWCADHEVNVKSYYYWLRKIDKIRQMINKSE